MGILVCKFVFSFYFVFLVQLCLLFPEICMMSVAVISSQVVEPRTNFTLICNVTCASNTTQVVWCGPAGPLSETGSTFDQDTITQTSLLTLANISYNDGGRYFCNVSSSGVNISTVVVIAPTISPTEISSTVGDNGPSFTCNVQSSLSSTINWYKYDLEGEVQDIIFTTDYGSGSASAMPFNNNLDFENVTFEDAGVYQCSVVTDYEVGEVRSANATFTGSFQSNVDC